MLDLLAAQTGFSRSRLKRIMGNGAVWLERGKQLRRLRRAGAKLFENDVLHLYFNERVQAQAPSPAHLVADEGDFSVWDKPAGMYSQGSKWGDHCSISRWAETHLQPRRPAFIVHRLDRAASGLIIVAHNKKAASRLSALFRQRKIIKHYRVWVHGRFPSAELLIEQPLDGRAARSYARRLKYAAASDRSLLEVRIETGRKHQIRRHLSMIGRPVVGDRMYGRMEDDEDLALRAIYLAFGEPVREYRAPL